jgi:hypothetical protein
VLPEYAAQLAAEGVQVSTISVGDGADVGTMREMAERGGGVFYNVINPSRLPRVFLKVVEVVRSPLVKEGRFHARGDVERIAADRRHGRAAGSSRAGADAGAAGADGVAGDDDAGG